jgi:hypothetical protein
VRFAVLLVLALACKDKTKTETPKPGSAIAPHAERSWEIDASSAAPKQSGPLDAAKLAQHDVAGWTRDVRLADAKGLEVRYRLDAILVTVQIAACFDCLPMQLDRWRAKSDALRALIIPELRDHASTTWELGMTDLGGPAVAWTFHAGDTGTMYGTAYTLYFNDGVHMIRVSAESTGYGSREAVSKSRLEAAARAFFDDFTRRWG